MIKKIILALSICLLFYLFFKNRNYSQVELSIDEVNVSVGSVSVLLKITNKSNSEIKIWDPLGDPGIYTISFELKDHSGAVTRFIRLQPKEDIGGSPRIISIKAKQSYVCNYNLFDGSWSLPNYIGAGNLEQITANLDICGGGMVDINNIYTGHVSSKSVNLNNYIKSGHYIYLKYLEGP